MKDWLAVTLFRRWGGFPWRIPLAVGILTMTTAASAGATDYSALITCGTMPPVFNSPVPVGLAGSGDGTSARAYAGSPVKTEAVAGVQAPNVPASDSRDCSASASANYTDIVIQGPAPTVLVRLHVPFHANIHQDFTVMTDGVNTISSANSANVQFNAQMFGGPAFARGGLEIRLNRQADIVNVIPFVATNAEFVPRPRIPGLVPLDSDGFITRFFQNSVPVTRNAPAFAGFRTFTIDEVRGEMILTTQVPTNLPITLALNMTVRSTSIANFFAAAFGAVSEGSISLPTDGAIVFELPDGFTAQVPSAGVIDNVVPQIFTCPKTVADWRNHPELWPLTTMALGTQTYTQDELLGILRIFVAATRPDASISLAQQVIAARLNEANGAAPGPMLQPSMVADTLFAGFGGKLPYRILPNTAAGQQMMNLALALSSYNAGQLAPVCVP